MSAIMELDGFDRKWTSFSSYRGGEIPFDGFDRINDQLPDDVRHLEVKGQGRWQSYGNEYLSASVADFVIRQEIRDYLLCGDHISIQFILEGDFDFNLLGHGRYCLTGGRAVIFVLPPGSRMERTIADGPNRHVGLAIPWTNLTGLFGILNHELRSEIVPILAMKRNDPLALEFQISSDQRNAIAVLLGTQLDGRVGKLFTHAKLMELACLSLGWLRKSSLAGNSIPCMRDKESYAIEKAVHMLGGRRGDKVSVRQVSREVGINRNKLSVGFRDRFGYTPAQYSRRAKLNKAIHLLDSSDFTIFEIAFESGFESQSSFSRAFRREFGCTPSEHRARSRMRT